MYRRKPNRVTRGLLLLALLFAGIAFAQTILLTEAARQVELALYQANVTQEALKTQMNADLRQRTEAIAALEAQLKSAKGQSKKQITALQDQLATAQAEVVRMLETDRSYREQIKIFRNEVTDLAKVPERLAALKIYNEGRVLEAVEILRRLNAAQVKAKERAVTIEAAALERQIASLLNAKLGAAGVTVAAVIASYEQVVTLDATEWDWYMLALLYEQSGNLSKKRGAAEKMLALATTPRAKAAALEQLGTAHATQGDAPSALLSFQEMLGISRDLAALDPTSAQAKRDLLVVLVKAGESFAASGKVTDALVAFQESLRIGRDLHALDTNSTRAKRDLYATLAFFGRSLAQHGKTPEALAAFDESLQISRELIKLDPTSARAKRDLAVSLNNVAQLLAEQRKAAQALAAFEESHSLNTELAALDPTSALAKRDLSRSLNRVGEIKAANGDATGALTAYQRSLEIVEALALTDPSSALARHDVIVSHFKLAGLAEQMGDAPAVLSHARQIDAIFSELEQQGLHISPDDRQWWAWVKSKIQQLENKP